MLGLAEDMASLGLSNEVFEDEFRFLVDLEHPFAGTPLESALDDEVAPFSVLVPSRCNILASP
jgi:hypothetical protein